MLLESLRQFGVCLPTRVSSSDFSSNRSCRRFFSEHLHISRNHLNKRNIKQEKKNSTFKDLMHSPSLNQTKLAVDILENSFATSHVAVLIARFFFLWTLVCQLVTEYEAK